MIMTGWLKKYGGQASVKNIDSAGHLEPGTAKNPEGKGQGTGFQSSPMN
jgi:hypothetical protein